jgi:hypothetical protein
MGGTRALQHLIAGKTCCRILILSLALLAASAQAEPLQVLSQNMNRFFDDVDDGNKEKILSRGRFRQRVETAAEKFANTFELPHIIALQEIENRNVLAQIAAEIERRHGARYRPILIPGHDPSGINLAYLVRYGVEIIKVEQLFGDKTHGAHANPLFSRPPLYLEACYIGNCLVLLKPQAPCAGGNYRRLEQPVAKLRAGAFVVNPGRPERTDARRCACRRRRHHSR